ncbi:MAG: tRNA pseudouridine(38-40) synthase TruA [Myxococcota bacterium]|nr:tRNA pseudouridine(38-40) synthase TruA [Myxococcota bacterium]
MRNFRLVLEYDGTAFEGWQTQARRGAEAGAEAPRTVQGILEAVLEQVTGVRAPVHGAGRTDAGVHALGQVANVALETRLEPAELQRALNAVLPRDLAVRALDVVPDAFHARRDARGKRYVYRLWTGVVRSPARARTHAWVQPPLDRDAMRRAARDLEGTHDFASFQAAGSGPKTTVRTLTRVALEGGPGDELRIVVEGSGFLRHMVRNLVGTLLEVGRGKRDAGSMPALLAARDRALAGATAPARGLVLERVDYAEQSE